MKKKEYLKALRKKLSHLPSSELNERINFYSEMIDDRMEEGLSEEEAVAAIDSAEEIEAQVSSEAEGTYVKEKKLSAFEITFLIIGSPVWLPILIAVFAVVLSVFAVLWSLTIALWAVEAPFFIFSFISKYLFVICKKATLCTVKFTKISYLYLLSPLRKGDGK